MDNEKFKAASQKYLKAREDFLTIANRTDWLFGNDNIVGRIGEFIAYQYLDQHQRKPERPKRKTEKGFDFICDEGKTKISVKTITFENKSGSTTIISEPWDELVLITINDRRKIEKMGILTKEQFIKAWKDGFIENNSPIARRGMLGGKGLINKYGTILNQKITENYL